MLGVKQIGVIEGLALALVGAAARLGRD
jgi:hypothetical protein